MMRNNEKSSVRPFLLCNCAPTSCARPSAYLNVCLISPDNQWLR